jgi:anti-sigma factor RsiW
MHNCRLTRNDLVDLALDEVPPAEAEQLLSELNGCSSCREEYATLSNTWRVSAQAMQSVLPREEFWPGYHARLKKNLTQRLSEEIEETSQRSLSSAKWVRIRLAVAMHTASLLSFVRQLATTSVRVPLPAALMLMLLFGVAVLALAGRASSGLPSVGWEPANTIPSTQLPSVETRLVPVSVIQERIVTRVVYVEKKSRRSTTSNPPDREDRGGPHRFVRAGSDASAETAMSLVGFKPTDQVKLSIIKGSHDEK